MNWWNKTYLARLVDYDKRLGIIACVFVALTLLFNLLGDQMAPFFVWGMFSQKNTEQPSYPVLQIHVDGELLDLTNLPDPQKHMLSSPLMKYAAQQENNGVDPTAIFLQSKLGRHYSKIESAADIVLNDSTDLAAFPAWAHRYIDDIRGQESKEIDISIVYYRYGQDEMILQNYKPVLRHAR